MKPKVIVVGVSQKLPMVDVVATVAPGQELLAAIKKYNPDFIIMDNATAREISGKSIAIRTNVVSSTHEGMKLAPIDQVYYFQAEHKYVIAYYNEGQLLIDDTLNSLEKEFSLDFIRIHRKTLVARKYIDSLTKNQDAQYMLKIKGVDKEFPVSRRQLPKLRKSILCL